MATVLSTCEVWVGSPEACTAICAVLETKESLLPLLEGNVIRIYKRSPYTMGSVNRECVI